MIDGEHAVLLKLGGTLNYLDIIDARYKELKDCEAYKTMPDDLLQRERVLEKSALMTISQDQVFLITTIIKVRDSLDRNDIDQAQIYINSMFR